MNVHNNKMTELYEANELSRQQERYSKLIRKFLQCFKDTPPLHLISVPGRTELGGNHTDHNNGKVLCAAVSRDSIAVFKPRSDNLIQLKSSEFPQLFRVDLTELNPRAKEKETTEALIRGVAAGFKKRGYAAGGFNAVVHSDISIGSGLSSSASFEVLVGGILNVLYNEDRIDPVTLAKIGQYAENVYFGKPCGLMDQLASAVGGVLEIDFKDNENPVVEKIQVDFGQSDFILAVVDIGTSHSDLTQAYASIPVEMKQVASLFGKNTLREVDEEEFRENTGMVRLKAGDRALLRAQHFFAENHRVGMMSEALKSGEFDTYLDLVAESGASSNSMLQNTIPPGNSGNDQPAALAIGVSNDFFRSRGKGVSRIHGGGFAGTIQSYIHKDHFEDYSSLMKRLFGDECVLPVMIRMSGVFTTGGIVKIQ
ncbi:MAG: galactokinase [Deltaproteobacteria bacterium]|nr:galactokinase [Deltaproteobacteria bacterium]